MKCHLEEIANRAMIEKGLDPFFPKEVKDELATIIEPASGEAEDLTSLLWCSIDNDDSRDLDQLTYAEGNTIYIAVADVTEIVKKDGAIDHHAQINTTSVYTPDKIFPLLPEKLSTYLTSLNPNEKRLAIVVKINFDDRTEIKDFEIKRAWVFNYAKLQYSKVGPWLKSGGPFSDPQLEETLRLQHTLAQKLKENRHVLGSLTLETLEVKPIVQDDQVLRFEPQEHNFAHQLIENFMIAANTCIARFLKQGRFFSLRRVVRVPDRWDRIVEVAYELGTKLPKGPDSKALDQFLSDQLKKNPERFPDLSLTIIKLLGSGEYVLEKPDDSPVGHFGLAIKDYTHSTAPNRRYPDIITQRQVKALLAKAPNPYSFRELLMLASHCTRQEDNAQKVERHLLKSAGACLLHTQIGNTFTGIITGSTSKGTWIRILNPPVEGKVVQHYRGLDVGDKVDVVLVGVDIERGFIDFSKK